MEFNEKLQELRKGKKLTQEELAQDLFVSRTAISKWESGRGYPSIDSLKEISRYFSVSIDEHFQMGIRPGISEHRFAERDFALLFGLDRRTHLPARDHFRGGRGKAGICRQNRFVHMRRIGSICRNSAVCACVWERCGFRGGCVPVWADRRSVMGKECVSGNDCNHSAERPVRTDHLEIQSSGLEQAPTDHRHDAVHCGGGCFHCIQAALCGDYLFCLIGD